MKDIDSAKVPCGHPIRINVSTADGFIRAAEKYGIKLEKLLKDAIVMQEMDRSVTLKTVVIEQIQNATEG